MNKLVSISTLALLIVLTTGLNTTITQAQPTPGAQCDNPTTTVTISAIPITEFDKNTLTVPKDTCVEITFINTDTVLHDFYIKSVSGDAGITEVYILIEAGKTASFNVQTPNADKTFEFICFQPGHKAAGMVGDFVVGEGSNEDDAPGFGFWLSMTAFLSLALLATKFRK